MERSLLQNRSLFQVTCPGSLWARDNRWLLSRVQRLAGPAGWGGVGGQRPPTGIKGWPFIPVGGSNRDKRPAQPFVPVGDTPFVPVGVSNRDKTPWSPYPLPSPPAQAIQLTCFLLFLARERGVLAHFFTTFVKIFDSPSIHQR